MIGSTMPIYDSEVREMVQERLREFAELVEPQRSEKETAVYREELKRLVERELLLDDLFAKLKKSRPQAIDDLERAATQEADRSLRAMRKAWQLTTDDEFKQLLALKGQTLTGMKRHLERNFMMSTYVREIAKPKAEGISLAAIRAYYDQNPKEFQVEDKVKWLGIFVSAGQFATPAEARQYADYVHARAARGEDFAALAKQYGHGDSKFREGEGFGTKPGEIQPPAVERVVLSLQPGQVGPLVQVDTGYHVVKVAERQFAGVKPFDTETQRDVRRRLENKVYEQEYDRLVSELANRTRVRLIDGAQ
jgi:parvulin-like peptidyl-prolyl isomerase